MAVSVPAMMSVAEGDGAVEVCVTLQSGATDDTERDFTVTLTTADDTGT